MRVGSLCSGYGGLELGAQAALGGDLAWVSDVDKGACRILDHRFPGVPNIGDMTGVDWSAVEPVDILTGGTPCQDLSTAGKRAGMVTGTRSNLWVAMREAVAVIRPRLIVWENVQGAYSAEAASSLESDPRLLDGTRRRTGEPVLRALGRVLGDLSSLGYVGGWHGLRAADIGAPHGRLRVFVVAHPAGDPWRVDHRNDGAPADPESTSAHGSVRTRRLPSQHRRMGGTLSRGVARPDPRTRPDPADYGPDVALIDVELDVELELLPTPIGRDWKDNTIRREPHRPDDIDTLSRALTVLLPTPVADNSRGLPSDGTDYQSLPNALAALLPSPSLAGQGYGYGPSDRDKLAALLPTPVATDAAGAGNRPTDKASHPGTSLTDATTREPDRWAQYAPAIRRWETLTRPAPAPIEHGPKGRPRLAPAFSEWMMGLPSGWVTDVPGLTRTEALKALGNGVVPQQAAAAIRHILEVAP